MENAPILREVYRMKDELNRTVGGDAGKLFERLRKSTRSAWSTSSRYAR